MSLQIQVQRQYTIVYLSIFFFFYYFVDSKRNEGAISITMMCFIFIENTFWESKSSKVS